jgi:hypothetical protein
MLSMAAGWLGPPAVGLALQGAGAHATIQAMSACAAVLALLAAASPSLRHVPGSPGGGRKARSRAGIQ